MQVNSLSGIQAERVDRSHRGSHTRRCAARGGRGVRPSTKRQWSHDAPSAVAREGARWKRHSRRGLEPAGINVTACRILDDTAAPRPSNVLTPLAITGENVGHSLAITGELGFQNKGR